MPRFRVLSKRKPEVKVSRHYTNPTTVENRRLDEQTLRFTVGGSEFEILGLPAVGRRLRCTETRIIQLVAEGKLKGYRLGRVWIVTDRDLDEFVEARRKELQSRYGGYLEG